MRRREFLAALLTGPIIGQRAIETQAADLTSLTMAQASARLAKREITPLQLTNAYLARIAKLNRDLNAFVTVTRALARREARNLPSRSPIARPVHRSPQSEGGSATADLMPLYGIPIAHKDLFETRGVRTTAGSRLFEDYVPENNAAIVQQLESAGAVLVGKTNTHELGGGVTTINPFFGTTRNPVDRTRIPGGSSGGSAAAVAARLCLAATGSDTGGSVRIPAAFCGCVGFKPTFGRISTQGLIAASPSFDHVGFLTRTVEDAQIVFSATSSASPSSNASPSSSASPSRVRVGVARGYFFEDLERVVADAVGVAIEGMKARGATIRDVSLPVSEKTMAQVFDPVFVFELWGRFGVDWRTSPGSFSKQFSAVFSAERPSVVEYESSLVALKEYQVAIDKLFDAVDVIATPTVAVTAPPITGPIDGMKILRNTWPFNAAGTPAISVPVSGTNLPVGLQFVARRGDDDKLLQIARRFESA
jgi:aspartyl-tRNA(Asn)/glutamyl-tRNA(Gln) amidotransferase subunit A